MELMLSLLSSYIAILRPFQDTMLETSSYVGCPVHLQDPVKKLELKRY